MKTQQNMRSSLPLTILTVTLLYFTLDANAQTCSEAFFKHAKQKNISECKRLRTLGAEFAWKLHGNGSDNSTVVDVLFGATFSAPQGWIGWGVNPGRRPEMVGTKAIIAVKRSDGTWNVDTYNITKEIRNGCNLLPSKIGIVLNKSVEQDVDNLHTMMYVRLNLSSEAYNVTRLNHVWQVGYDIEGWHPLGHPKTLRNVDSTEVVDLTDSNGRGTGQYRSYLRSIHGVLNIIGWGTLLPIGIIIARYFRVFPFKCDPLWFNLHIGCQLTGFLVGTTGWAIGLSLGHSSRYYTFRDHRTYGILIFTFSTIQMLAFRLKPKLTDDYRKYWNMYHHFLGYGLLAIIFINIFKGIRILEGGDAWKWGYVADLAFLGAIAFGLEVYTWIRFFMLKQEQRQHKQQNDPKKTQDQHPPKQNIFA